MIDQRNTKAAKHRPSDALPDDALLKELTKAARKDLKPSLIKAGASKEDKEPDSAEWAVLHIAALLANFRTERQRGIDALGEIKHLHKLLAAAKASIEKLTPCANATLRVHFKQYDDKQNGHPGSPEDEPVDSRNAFRDIKRALPDVVGAMIPHKPKKGGHDPGLHLCIVEAATIWWKASTQWPLATTDSEGAATAPLYLFIARHAYEEETVSASVWVRAVRAAKKPEREKLGLPADGRRKARRTK